MKLRRTILSATAFAAISIFLSGCGSTSVVEPTATPSNSTTPIASPTLYQNLNYGFSFQLPKSWIGYSIVKTTWQGRQASTGKVIASGPLISIRHPKWSGAHIRQDIPILVYTISQWSALIAEKFNMGAAPIPPSELARNAKYVFALSARYNFAFPTGFQEVETILQGSPLTAF